MSVVHNAKTNFMRKFTIFFCVLISFFGCQNPTQQKVTQAENKQQDKFIGFLKEQCNDYSTKVNDIQRKEFFDQYEKNIVNLSDSIGILNNWEGTIKDIKTFDWSSNEATELRVELEIKLSDDYQKLTFISDRILANKSLDSNLIYNQVKNLTIGSSVYFDGFFSKNKANKLDFKSPITFDNKDKICDPDINFYLVSISKNKLAFTNSDKFKKVNEIQLAIWKTMEDRVEKKITESQFKNKLRDFKNLLEPLATTFTKEEKQYVASMTNCLVLQFNKD